MNRKTLSILLIVVMVVCFAGAVYYPIQYSLQKGGNESDMDELRNMRRSALEDNADRTQNDNHTGAEDGTSEAASTVSPTGGSALTEAAVGGSETESEAAATEKPQQLTATESPDALPTATAVPTGSAGDSDEAKPAESAEASPKATAEAEPEATAEASLKATAEAEPEATTEASPKATAEPEPEQTDRYYRESSALPYDSKEQVRLDPEQILPQYREIYEQNDDLVGWLYVPGTKIDYPVLQSEEHDYYLRRDFYGEENKNGQLILDSSCDPWTPSYNLVITGHNMKSGDMFGTLTHYESRSFWKNNKTFTYDSLMREGTYVVFGAFYSADFDVDEEGFRYNADIQYKLDAELWLEEVRENRLYDTGIDVEFGDEIITLTTCLYHRENGRFVVVARRVREGEVIE